MANRFQIGDTSGASMPEFLRQPYSGAEQAQKFVQPIGQAVSIGYQALTEPDRQRKIQNLIRAYNDPSDTGFIGTQGAARTERLVELLQPIDPSLAERYRKRAFEEALSEKEFGQRQQLEKEDKLKGEETRIRLEAAKNKYVEAVESGDMEKIKVAEIEYNAVLNRAPTSMVYAGAREVDQSLRERGLETTEKRSEFEQKIAEQRLTLDWAKLKRQDQERQQRQDQFIEKMAFDREKANRQSKKYTEGQYLAAGFGLRMNESNAVLNQFDEGFSSALRTSARLPNILQGSETQQFNQAKRNFINATLRRESGAAISPSEFENAEKQYFPVEGDTKSVLDQKSNNRKQAIALMKANAGMAYDDVVNAYNIELSGSTKNKTQMKPTQNYKMIAVEE